MNTVHEMNTGFDIKRDTPVLSGISDASLEAEIVRRSSSKGTALAIRESTCGSNERGEYNTPLHVMALFLVLVLSTLACSFPVLTRRFPRFPVPRRFLFISRHFGTGVLIATAFVHLLPTAFGSLTDPCLPRFWNKSFPAMAGFVAMISVFVVVSIEMFFASKGARHVHKGEYVSFISDDHDDPSGGTHYHRVSAQNDETRMEDGVDRTQVPAHLSDEPTYEADPGKEDSDTELDELPPYTNGDTGVRHRRSFADYQGLPQLHADGGGSYPATSNASPQNTQRQLLQCLLLEAGILFHSIFIGMALSVATGTSFIVLLVAICFHQTFEGFALGSRIASLIPNHFSPSSLKPWLMSVAYGTTTPIGQAAGLILHNLYDPASAGGLIMVGITNAISSGLLLFAGLVELLAEDFLSESSYETLRGRRRIEACLSVASGAMVMAFIGAWA